MSFEFISLSTRERAQHVFLSRAITVIKSRSCITTFLAVELLFHFDRSMQLHSSLRKVFLPLKSFVQSSSWILSPASRLEGEGKSPPLCSPGKNLIPFLLPRSFVEYSPRFPRDSFSFLPSFLLFAPLLFYFPRSIKPTIVDAKLENFWMIERCYRLACYFPFLYSL